MACPLRIFIEALLIVLFVDCVHGYTSNYAFASNRACSDNAFGCGTKLQMFYNTDLLHKPIPVICTHFKRSIACVEKARSICALSTIGRNITTTLQKLREAHRFICLDLVDVIGLSSMRFECAKTSVMCRIFADTLVKQYVQKVDLLSPQIPEQSEDMKDACCSQMYFKQCSAVLNVECPGHRPVNHINQMIDHLTAYLNCNISSITRQYCDRVGVNITEIIGENFTIANQTTNAASNVTDRIGVESNETRVSSDVKVLLKSLANETNGVFSVNDTKNLSRAAESVIKLVDREQKLPIDMSSGDDPNQTGVVEKTVRDWEISNKISRQRGKKMPAKKRLNSTTPLKPELHKEVYAIMCCEGNGTARYEQFHERSADHSKHLEVICTDATGMPTKVCNDIFRYALLGYQRHEHVKMAQNFDLCGEMNKMMQCLYAIDRECYILAAEKARMKKRFLAHFEPQIYARRTGECSLLAGQGGGVSAVSPTSWTVLFVLVFCLAGTRPLCFFLLYCLLFLIEPQK